MDTIVHGPEIIPNRDEWGNMIFMSRGTDDARARKAQAEVQALLSSLNSKGRLAPIPRGTIVKGTYRIERYLRGSDLRNVYLVSWNDQVGARHCWECGFDRNLLDDVACQQCHSDLGGRQFILSERWRADSEVFHEAQELGLFHPGIGRTYEMFEDEQRLFVLSELPPGGFLADAGSPFAASNIISLGLSGCEVFEYLHQNGVGLGPLAREHLALTENSLAVHDPEFSTLYPSPTPPEHQTQHIASLGRALRDLVPPDLPALRLFFESATDGNISSLQDFQTQLQGFEPLATPPPDVPSEAAMSDVGMCRTLNEDNWGWETLSPELMLYAVADGMGGHDSGEVASELAVRTLLSGIRRRMGGRKKFDDGDLETILDESFQEANNTVKGFSEKRRSDMGTTMVSILLHHNSTLFVANVGDSRCYLLRKGTLTQISEDHSLVANLVAMGKISKAAAKNHPHSNILVRTVGKEWNVEIDIFRRDVLPGDVLLLCSDGLWGEVDEDDLVELLRDFPDPRVACQELVRAANVRGGHDNITAVVIRVPDISPDS